MTTLFKSEKCFETAILKKFNEFKKQRKLAQPRIKL